MPWAGRKGRLDVQRRVVAIALLVTGLGYAFDGYNNSVFGLVLPWMAHSLHLTYLIIGSISSAFLFVYAFGATIAGYFADLWGRRPLLMGTILGYAVGALGMGLSTGIGMLTASRSFSGLALGGEIPVGWAYMAEQTSGRVRGRWLGMQQAFWPVGYLFATLVVLVLAHHWLGTVSSGLAWRLAFLVGVLPAVLVIWIRYGMRESNTWTDNKQTNQKSLHPQIALTTLFQRHLMPSVLLGSLLQITGTVVFSAAMTWFPLYLVKVVHLTVVQETTDLVVWVAAAIVGQVLSGWLSDHWGRKTLTIIFTLGQGLCFYAFTHILNPTTLLLLAPIVGFFVLGMWGVISVWMNELFPTAVRASGLGVTATVGRLVNVASPLLVGVIATSAGLRAALIPFPALSLLTVICLLLWRRTPTVPQFSMETPDPSPSVVAPDL